MVNKQDFACNHCGQCCLTFTVKLSEQDIKNIKSLGYKLEDFAEKDNFDPSSGKYALKRPEGRCIFLTQTEKNVRDIFNVSNNQRLSKTLNNFECKIYGKRPIICKQYPFNESDEVDTCIPKKSTIK